MEGGELLELGGFETAPVSTYSTSAARVTGSLVLKRSSKLHRKQNRKMASEVVMFVSKQGDYVKGTEARGEAEDFQGEAYLVIAPGGLRDWIR